MRKNGSRLISLRQYRATDLFLFAVILTVFDLLAHYALSAFSQSATFIFTLTAPITVLVMMRWGWQAVFFAVGDGILFSILKSPAAWESYLCYGLGNAAMMLLLIPLKFIGKRKIAGKWYFSAAFAIVAWFLMDLGVTCLQAACGADFGEAFIVNFGFGYTGLMSLAIDVLLIVVLRRLDGMFEDQKTYLLRLDRERKDRMRRDEFGDEPIDIDEETLSILNKRDDELE